MLCIHQNPESFPFKGPISQSTSPVTNPSPGLEDDFSDISADLSFDDPLENINILDQMFNNQQSSFDSIGLDQGQSLSSTYSPTDSSSVQQLNFQTSSGLNFNIDNSNNNNSNNEANIIISSNNPSSFIGSTETSLSSAPTTPNSATLPSFTEIYSSRNFTTAQHPHPQQSHSGLTVTGSNADDASSFFKFDDIELNDDDNTSLSEVSFASVSMKKSNQGSGSLMDLSSIKQENECEDIVNVSNQISIQSAINQQSKNQQLQLHHHHQHQHQHHQQNQLQQQLLHSQLHRINQSQQVNQQQFTSSSTHQDVAFTGISSVASSPGYISMSSTRSTPNLDQYQSQYQQSISRQQQQLYPHHSRQYNHMHYNIQLSPQLSPMFRSSYQSTGSPVTQGIPPSSSNQALTSELNARSQMSLSKSSLSLSGSPNIFSDNAPSNVLGYTSKNSSGRSSPSEQLVHGLNINRKPRAHKQVEASLMASSSAAMEATGQPCAVCGDSAACAHYGVRTCEGCKGFFKRTVQKGRKYVCSKNRECPVDKRRRNQCQFCRFQKCLAVGMVKEVVRTDNLKGRRGRLPSKPKSPQESPPSPPISTITALVRAHVDTCPDISNLDFSHYCEIDDSDLTPEAILSYHHQFVDVLSSALETCRNFAEKIIGFADLNKHDQDLLFYSSFFEIIALRTAYQNKPGSRKIILPNGIVLHRNQAKLLFGSWFTNLESFAQRFAQIDIDISAFACLSGLSLITNRHGLVDPSRVEALQMKIIESLRDHVTYNADAQKKSHYFSSILSKLPDLRSLAMDGLRHLHEIKLESIVTIPEPISRLLTNLSYY